MGSDTHSEGFQITMMLWWGISSRDHKTFLMDTWIAVWTQKIGAYEFRVSVYLLTNVRAHLTHQAREIMILLETPSPVEMDSADD